MDALAKEVDENLSVLDTTFGKDDTLVDEKVKEAVKNLKDGELCGEVVEGENGYYVMSDAWFSEYTYQVVVNKKYLTAQQVEELSQEPIPLEPWDHMGSLA